MLSPPNPLTGNFTLTARDGEYLLPAPYGSERIRVARIYPDADLYSYWQPRRLPPHVVRDGRTGRGCL